MQVQKPNMQNQNQFYLASQQQQPSYGLVGLPRGSQSQSMKDSQPTRNDGSVGSPGQINSPKVMIFFFLFVKKVSYYSSFLPNRYELTNIQFFVRKCDVYSNLRREDDEIEKCTT